MMTHATARAIAILDGRLTPANTLVNNLVEYTCACSEPHPGPLVFTVHLAECLLASIRKGQAEVEIIGSAFQLPTCPECLVLIDQALSTNA